MSTTQLSAQDVAAALRRWAGKDHHQQAGEDLLVEHGFWLSRADFLEYAVHYDTDEDAARILWSAARDFLDTHPRASTSELAVLDFATALGEDRYQLTAMGSGHRAMLRTAVHTATGDR